MANYEKRKSTTQIIVHCTATSPATLVTIKKIDEWHKARGFQGIGYHFVVDRDGTILGGRPLDAVGAHCMGHNHDSVGIAWVGGISDKSGIPQDNRTAAQKASLKTLIKVLKEIYPSINHVWGHNHYKRSKACPCFDAHKELNDLVN